MEMEMDWLCVMAPDYTQRCGKEKLEVFFLAHPKSGVGRILAELTGGRVCDRWL